MNVSRFYYFNKLYRACIGINVLLSCDIPFLGKQPLELLVICIGYWGVYWLITSFGTYV